MSFEIIAVPIRCVDEGWRICGNDKLREVVHDPIQAKKLALEQRAPGMGVIIRPRFHEPHLGRHAFREWRSFDGGLFSEIHWLLEGQTPSQVRRDEEIILPHPPG